MHCLLYLNEFTFVSDDEVLQDNEENKGNARALTGGLSSKTLELIGSTVAFVRWALQTENVRMVLVHEQDIAFGACPFRYFFETTPPDLLTAGLYDTVLTQYSNRCQ